MGAAGTPMNKGREEQLPGSGPAGEQGGAARGSLSSAAWDGFGEDEIEGERGA
jgi:hypothetical protein